VSEIRASDDATAARVDAMLAVAREAAQAPAGTVEAEDPEAFIYE